MRAGQVWHARRRPASAGRAKVMGAAVDTPPCPAGRTGVSRRWCGADRYPTSGLRVSRVVTLRGPRRARVWIAGAVVVALVGGGVAWWGVDRAAERALTDSLAALDGAVSDLDEVVTAGSVLLGESAGRVEDDRVRTDLATAVESVTALDTDLPVDGDRSARTDVAAALTAEVTEQTAVVTVAVERVSDAVTAWELAQATTVHAAAAAALGATITAGEQVLTDTDGRVADNTVRERLRTALDAAITTRDAAPGEQSLDALRAAAGAADTARVAVEAAVQSVTNAHGAWQGEQDRIAAEQAAAAAAATQNSGSGNRSSGSSKGSTGAPAPAANSGTPGSRPNGLADIGSEMNGLIDGGSNAICGNTKGDSWIC